MIVFADCVDQRSHRGDAKRYVVPGDEKVGGVYGTGPRGCRVLPDLTDLRGFFKTFHAN